MTPVMVEKMREFPRFTSSSPTATAATSNVGMTGVFHRSVTRQSGPDHGSRPSRAMAKMTRTAVA